MRTLWHLQNVSHSFCLLIVVFQHQSVWSIIHLKDQQKTLLTLFKTYGSLNDSFMDSMVEFQNVYHEQSGRVWLLVLKYSERKNVYSNYFDDFGQKSIHIHFVISSDFRLPLLLVFAFLVAKSLNRSFGSDCISLESIGFSFIGNAHNIILIDFAIFALILFCSKLLNMLWRWDYQLCRVFSVINFVWNPVKLPTNNGILLSSCIRFLLSIFGFIGTPFLSRSWITVLSRPCYPVWIFTTICPKIF